MKPVPTPDDPKRHIPHNPFVEAGAIVACSLILADTNSSNRFSHVLATMSRICYSSTTAFCNETYLKMRASANREMCLAHMLQEYHSFPDGIDLEKTLELYFQTRALKSSTYQILNLLKQVCFEYRPSSIRYQIKSFFSMEIFQRGVGHFEK